MTHWSHLVESYILALPQIEHCVTYQMVSKSLKVSKLAQSANGYGSMGSVNGQKYIPSDAWASKLDTLKIVTNMNYISRTENRRGVIQIIPWWRHEMHTFSALLALCAGNSPVTGEFPPQMPVTRNFDVFFDLRLNKRLSKQLWRWWFETPSCS